MFKLRFPLLAICFCVLAFPAHSAGWRSDALAEDIEVVARASPPSPAGSTPLVIYLLNLAHERVGTDSDEAILSDFEAAGYMVTTLDYRAHPRARLPYLNRDFAQIRDAIRAGTFPVPNRPDQTRVFIIPSGHRLHRDVAYFHDEKRTLAFDLVYPSKPSRKVGTVLEFSCDNKDRMGNTSLSICSDTVLDGLATEGFAVAMADHPVAAPYKGLDAMPDSAIKIKAAVRTLRATALAHGMNTRIVPVGFSRGSGMALMLLTTEGMAEFEGAGENQGVDSAVQGAVVMSGRFTYLDLLPGDHMIPRYTKAWGDRGANHDVWKRHGALDYLQKPTVPLFLTINCTEGEDALHQMKTLRKRLADLGSDELFMMDRNPRGHKVTLEPEILEAMYAYIARQLKN